MQIGHGVFQKIEAHEEEGKPEDKLSQRFILALRGEDKRERYSHQGDGKRADREFPESEESNDPRGERGTDIGPHYHADGLH